LANPQYEERVILPVTEPTCKADNQLSFGQYNSYHQGCTLSLSFLSRKVSIYLTGLRYGSKLNHQHTIVVPNATIH